MHFFRQDLRKYIYGVLGFYKERIQEKKSRGSMLRRNRRNYHCMGTCCVRYLAYIILDYLMRFMR